MKRRLAEDLSPRVHLAVPRHVRRRDPLGREHTGERVKQERLDPQVAGDRTRVLASGAAEHHHRVLADVVPARDGDVADRLCHVLDRDAEEPLGDVFGGARRTEAAGDFGEGAVDPAPAQRDREAVGHDSAEYEVDVGERKLPRARRAVAQRPRVCAHAVGPDREAMSVVAADRSTAGRDGMDREHRRPDAHARDLGLVGTLELAAVPADVGRGAAHVEADRVREPEVLGDPSGGDDTPRRSGQDRVLAPEPRGAGEPPAALHHLDRAAGEAVGQGGEVALEHGGEVRVHDRRIGAGEQAELRRDLVGGDHVLDPELAGGDEDLVLELGRPVPVHDHDGDAVDPLAGQRGETAPKATQIRAGEDRAVGGGATFDLDDLLGERGGAADREREDVGAALVPRSRAGRRSPR